MIITLIIGAILACIRIWMGFTIVPEHANLIDVYKDVAHLFIGGLCVSAWLSKEVWQWQLFWFLCILEIIIAIFSRM